MVSADFPPNLSDKCLFCNIIQRKIPSQIVYETEDLIAFLDINPVSEGHTQIIPKYHAETILDLPSEYLAAIGPALRVVAEATGVKNFNVMQNNGKIAFQHVPHVHFHIIPKRTEKEGLIFDMDNIQSMWPMKKAEQSELAKTAERMRKSLELRETTK